MLRSGRGIEKFVADVMIGPKELPRADILYIEAVSL